MLMHVWLLCCRQSAVVGALSCVVFPLLARRQAAACTESIMPCVPATGSVIFVELNLSAHTCHVILPSQTATVNAKMTIQKSPQRSMRSASQSTKTSHSTSSNASCCQASLCFVCIHADSDNLCTTTDQLNNAQQTQGSLCVCMQSH